MVLYLQKTVFVFLEQFEAFKCHMCYIITNSMTVKEILHFNCTNGKPQKIRKCNSTVHALRLSATILENRGFQPFTDHEPL